MAAESLAQGIVASGSSDSKWGSFPGATDGKKGTPWHGRPGDMPATLALNLGLPTTVAGMSILTWPGAASEVCSWDSERLDTLLNWCRNRL